MASLVSTSRFKTLPVTKRSSIKAFVEEKALSFKKGRGFYQLSKPELIQDHKEIIVRRKTGGAFLTGDKVREVLGIPKTSKKFKLDLADIDDFDVFVQSTSVNRVLLPDTEFLYEADDEPPTDGKSGGAKGSGRPARKKSAATDEPEPKRRATGKRGAAAATEAKKKPVTAAKRGRGRKAVETEDSEEADDEPVTAAPAAKRGRGRKAVKTEDTDEPDDEPVTAAPAAKRGRGRKAVKKIEDTDEPDDEEEEEVKSKPSPAKKVKIESPPASGPAAAAAAATTGSGGGPVEIVFSFDTTGSMYPCLTQVRRSVSSTIKRLHKEIPGIRVAIIAHGDYCDASYAYVTNILDFTSDEKKLCDFVEKVGSTGGGDWEECYELVLHETRTKLSWTPGTQRSLVMIGDAIPHPPSYSLNTLKLDWKKEAKSLYDELGIRIYSVQALNNSMSASFYRSLADLTCGYHLHLDQFASIVDFLMAICFNEQSMDKLQMYEDEVRSRGTGLNRSLHTLFDTLAGRTTTYTGGTGTDGLVAVNSARFQILDVDDRCDIKTFVQRNGLLFKAGRGFYEFTKAEKVSHKKEVVLVDKVTGDVFTGPEACRLIGAGGEGKIKPTCLEKWRVFVQSTSYNRMLMPNTGFLYEVDPDH